MLERVRQGSANLDQVRRKMPELTNFVFFILMAVAIALAVIVGAIFCIGVSELGAWMWGRSHAQMHEHQPRLVHH